MKKVMKTCVILHNLIIVDHEIEHNLDFDYINDAQYIPEHGMTIVPRGNNQNGVVRGEMIAAMQDNHVHYRLQQDLMAERWATWFAENGDDDEAMDGGIED